ncbi:MAG: hypothetical protein Q8K70_06995 [Bacteroidota bacterium]|nr:hypothetical protein [Bacteroidota bacterium]
MKTFHLFKIQIPLLILGLVYFLLPNQNPQIDSWYYAACVKHHHELFNSHHLLYNVWGHCFYTFLKFVFPHIEAIKALNFMNALSATVSLFVLFRILKNMGTQALTALWLTLFCGVSFGFWRFASDAETYSLPLMFALLATLFYSDTKKYTSVWCALFSVLAILTHQLYIWWAVALFLGHLLSKSQKNTLAFSIILLFVPLVYYVSYLLLDSDTNGFINFILGEYSKGNAGIHLSGQTLLLGGINLIRTFVQVHGNMIYLFNEFGSFYWFLILLILYFVFKNFKLKNLQFVEAKLSKNALFFVALIGFVLHFLFALVSDGNAEFMSMLPFLMVIGLAAMFEFKNVRLLATFTVLLFVWNLSFAILPNHFKNISQVNLQVKYTIQNPHEIFVWTDKPLVENQVDYVLGFTHSIRYIKKDEVNIDSMTHILKQGKKVYTDIGLQTTHWTRASMIEKQSETDLNRYFKFNKVDSFENLYGKNYIYQLLLNNE